MNIAEEPDVK